MPRELFEVTQLRFTFFCVRMTEDRKDLMMRLITLLLLCFTLVRGMLIL